MATYSYKVEFSDGEIIMLRSALLQMIEKCESEILQEPKASFIAFKHHAEEVLKRLEDNVSQMSFNNFDGR